MGIGETLRRLRKEKKLTQLQLSEETGISVHSINSYESGRREPNSKAMAALERYFNVSGAYLRGETDDPVMYKWDDKEMMEVVHDGLSRVASVVTEAARASDECSKKMTFDILVELRHILSLDPSQRPASMMLLQETFGITTRYIDSCFYAVAQDSAKFESMKKSRIQDFIAALNHFEFGKHNSSEALTLMDFESDISAGSSKTEKGGGKTPPSSPELVLLDNTEPPASQAMRSIPLYDQPVSAGTGTFLDSEQYRLLELPIDAVPAQANFAVRVSGDSMEPDFYEDDIVFVRQQPTVFPGQIGVFMLDGNAYIKQYEFSGKKGGFARLVSLNQDYDPIIIDIDHQPRTLGRVIGKLKQE